MTEENNIHRQEPLNQDNEENTVNPSLNEKEPDIIPGNKETEAKPNTDIPGKPPKEEEKKEKTKSVSPEELFSSGASEEENIDLYKQQIEDYSLLQLRNILHHIDQEKFTLRYRVLKEAIEKKEKSQGQPENKETEAKLNTDTPEKALKEQKTKEIKQHYWKKFYSNNKIFLKFCLSVTIIMLLISSYILLMFVINLPGKELLQTLI